MQACLSSSSPVGQSMKPSHRTWSSMQWYLPILSAVGQANLSIPSSETGHSVNRIAKILLQSVGMKLTLCLNRKYSTGIMHVNVNVNIIRYLGGVGKIVHERYRGKMRERLGVIFPTWKRSGFPHKVYIILVVVFVTSSVFVVFFPPMTASVFGISGSCGFEINAPFHYLKRQLIELADGTIAVSNFPFYNRWTIGVNLIVVNRQLCHINIQVCVSVPAVLSPHVRY